MQRKPYQRPAAAALDIRLHDHLLSASLDFDRDEADGNPDPDEGGTGLPPWTGEFD